MNSGLQSGALAAAVESATDPSATDRALLSGRSRTSIADIRATAFRQSHVLMRRDAGTTTALIPELAPA